VQLANFLRDDCMILDKAQVWFSCPSQLTHVRKQQSLLTKEYTLNIILIPLFLKSLTHERKSKED